MNVTENFQTVETENNDTLLPAGTEAKEATDAAVADDPETDKPERPEGIPDKFWDAETSQLRTDALVKSYVELEKKLGGLNGRQMPSRPEDYQIDTKNDLLTSDPSVNALLHEAGFSQEQAQMVYDLASERLMPMVAEIASLYETEGQVARLAEHFGSESRWQEASRQIESWGRSSLPTRVFEALSTTYEGVLAMQRMMDTGEPGLGVNAAQSEAVLSESSLKALMRDPRYWRDKEPAIVSQVRNGFKQLYKD